MTTYRFTNHFLEDRWPEDALALAIPVPPTTATQRSIGMELPCCWQFDSVMAANVQQEALFVAPTDRFAGSHFSMQVSIPAGARADSHFDAPDMPCFCPGADALEVCEGLSLAGMDDQKRVDAIVECLKNKYRYQHGTNSDLPLTCDLLVGNCLDINVAFIRLLRTAGIRSAYYIGYFFEAGKAQECDDWHCWVDTLSERGYESWDIAHFLKRGRSDVGPALNPIPGMRVALSTGRDLQFSTAYGHLQLGHLCEPRWVLAGGRTRQARINVIATPMPPVGGTPEQAATPMAPVPVSHRAPESELA